jgi:two-component system, OmpR family, sensor histidine kinase ChvG
VIEHDVRRLDRLVSDISNASRLDSELVKEDEAAFNLLKMLSNISDFMGNEARAEGGRVHHRPARRPIVITGLGSAAGAGLRQPDLERHLVLRGGRRHPHLGARRENRVLVVVEDTGPGIPEQALTKIFNRFYSERPQASSATTRALASPSRSRSSRRMAASSGPRTSARPTPTSRPTRWARASSSACRV